MRNITPMCLFERIDPASGFVGIETGVAQSVFGVIVGRCNSKDVVTLVKVLESVRECETCGG